MLGINLEKLTCLYAGRNGRLTGVLGNVLRDLMGYGRNRSLAQAPQFSELRATFLATSEYGLSLS